jgi:hypothetical protein
MTINLMKRMMEERKVGGGAARKKPNHYGQAFDVITGVFQAIICDKYCMGAKQNGFQSVIPINL